MDNQNIPIDCPTWLTFENSLTEAENAANQMSLLESAFKTQIQHLDAKLAEAKTKAAFEEYPFFYLSTWCYYKFN